MTTTLNACEIAKALFCLNLGYLAGFAAGPILAALSEHLFIQMGQAHHAALANAANFLFVMLTLLACAILYQALPAGLDGNADTPSQTTLAASRKDVWRNLIMLGSLGVITLGHLLLQLIEVGTSLLLEVHFGWSTQNIGLAIGFALLSSLPWAGLTDAFIGISKTQVGKMFRLFTCWIVVVLNCCLFLPGLFPQFSGWLPVLAADMIVVGITAAAGAVIDGGTILLTTGNDGVWSSKNLAVISNTTYTIRGLAGPLARYLISNDTFGGQAAYGMGQIILAMLGLPLLLAVLAVLPRDLTEPAEACK